jgi:predicted HTH transcriptional regulator
VRRIIAGISAISFTVVLIATIFLWRRFQRDIAQSALPPAVNEMTDNDVLRAIAAGEDDRLEFKSTLRWNLHTNKPDKAMEIACLKTMAAFLNSEGGTLLVGVEDNGNILGVAADQFPNEDKFLLHFNNLINQHLGLETAGSFSFDIRHLESGDIMIVDCQPSPAPVYVTHDRKEEFYVRVGPGTRPLTTRDALEYIRNHF